MLIDNYYSHCGNEWILEDCDSCHDDNCSSCDAEMTPYKSVSHTEDGEKTTWHASFDELSIRAASCAFGVELPFNFTGLDKAEQEKILGVSRCDKYDGISNDEYFSLIDTHSDTIKCLVKDVLNRVKAELVHAAIECELPSDFNELDLYSMAGLD